MSITNYWRKKVLPLFKRYERNLVFFVSFAIITALAFEMGTLTASREDIHKTLVIEKPTVSLAQIKQSAGIEEGRVAGAQSNNAQPTTHELQVATTQQEASKNAQACLFVGSKNSDKYHSPSCSYAKRIKPENRVCFASEEEAKAKGYVQGCIQ